MIIPDENVDQSAEDLYRHRRFLLPSLYNIGAEKIQILREQGIPTESGGEDYDKQIEDGQLIEDEASKHDAILEEGKYYDSLRENKGEEENETEQEKK